MAALILLIVVWSSSDALQLLPGFWLNFQRQPIAGSHSFNDIFIAGFHFSQGIRVVVDVLYLARPDLHNLVASFQTSSCGG